MVGGGVTPRVGVASWGITQVICAALYKHILQT